MKESFYHYILKERDPHHQDAISQLAYAIAKDGSFPKTSTSYKEITTYLEEEVDYVRDMTTFDQVWDQYITLKS